MSPRVLVAGGGIAGLAAARELALGGASVVLVEADRLGGRLRTSRFAGRMVDEAADTFLARVPGAVELARDVGLGGELVAPSEVPAYLLGDGGALHPIPSEQVLGVPTDLEVLAATGLCTPEGLARAAADLTAPAGPPLDGDVAIGTLTRARLGDEVHERLVDPLIGGINAGDTDHLSLATVAPQIDAAARSGEASLIRACASMRARAARGAAAGPMFLTPERGMGGFASTVADDAAARGVEIRVPAALVALEPGAGGRGWRAVVREGRTGGPHRGGRDGDTRPGPGSGRDGTGRAGGRPTGDTAERAGEEVVEVDAVVLATPAPVTARLLSGSAPSASGALSGIGHASVALVTLAFDPADVTLPLPGSGFLVPRRAGLLTTACSWTSSKWPHLAPGRGDGTVIVRASAGRIDDHRIDDLDDSDLSAAIVAELGPTSGVAGAPREVRVSRFPGAFPQYAVGHRERMRSVAAELADRAPGIALAGAALAGVGVPACIRSGRAATAALAEHLGAASRAQEPPLPAPG